MPVRINVVNSLEDFCKDIQNLITAGGYHLYLMKIAKSKRETIRLNESIEDISSLLNKDYHAFYITSEVYDEDRNSSFFDDDFFHYVIEGLGGRSTDSEIENINLRIVSKTPDKKITSLMNAIDRLLKKSEVYGRGINPSSGSLYKNAFYKKEIVFNKTCWFDFQRKFHPIDFGD
ncbi:hypothetical protein ACR79M_20525 [Sphingobacterium spiritivorum]|uniref:hypothetical protein n=1 Tax=Sphingobacterium TaxID=28453 RepID=UPI0025F981FC|nr:MULTISPECIES: hypothetical protein [unclassified Sphingobacterium]